MKITSIRYAERVVTTQYAYKELEMSAAIRDGDNANECVRMLEHMVKSQLGLKTGDLNVTVHTSETGKVASNDGAGKTTPKPKSSPKAKKAPKAKAVKAEVVNYEMADVQNALRDVAVFHKDASKAVALIETVAGVKTLADVPTDKYTELVNLAKKVVA